MLVIHVPTEAAVFPMEMIRLAVYAPTDIKELLAKNQVQLKTIKKK